jgi:hypothetical protein
MGRIQLLRKELGEFCSSESNKECVKGIGESRENCNQNNITISK